ncbi:MAG: ATP synthase F1 subunit delta [Planctomycetes bacterium]|nr:ATP synthase F1 subunit delta [Planctomycetota bacterium]
MASTGDKAIGVARVYAQAILSLAESHGEADRVLVELMGLASYVERSPEFETFCTSPTIDAESRKRSVEKMFRGKVSDVLTDALQVVSRKDRLELLREIAEQYRLAHEDLRGRVDVYVRTAVPLPGPLRDRVAETARRYSGREVDLVETVDESLIGGMVISIGDRKFDTSVSTQLKALAMRLSERASKEIHGERTYLVGAT